MTDLKELTKPRLMQIDKGSIFTRKSGYCYSRFGLALRRRRKTEPSGRIISVTYEEKDGKLVPYKYVAELSKDQPVLCGLIKNDFMVDVYDNSLVYFGDLSYEWFESRGSRRL